MVKKFFIYVILGGGVACQPEAVERRSAGPSQPASQNGIRNSGTQQPPGGDSTNSGAETRLSTLGWDGISPLTSGQFRLLVVE